MWARTFETRLSEWITLRDNSTMSDEEYLEAVNEWWHQTPWSPYYLHWDDVEQWPTPWDLLADNIFCPVSRGLGMIYTLALSPRTFQGELAELGSDTIVLVGPEIYTLNYSPTSIVNIKLPGAPAVNHTLSIDDIKKKLI